MAFKTTRKGWKCGECGFEVPLPPGANQADDDLQARLEEHLQAAAEQHTTLFHPDA